MPDLEGYDKWVRQLEDVTLSSFQAAKSRPEFWYEGNRVIEQLSRTTLTNEQKTAVLIIAIDEVEQILKGGSIKPPKGANSIRNLVNDDPNWNAFLIQINRVMERQKKKKKSCPVDTPIDPTVLLLTCQATPNTTVALREARQRLPTDDHRTFFDFLLKSLSIDLSANPGDSTDPTTVVREEPGAKASTVRSIGKTFKQRFNFPNAYANRLIREAMNEIDHALDG